VVYSNLANHDPANLLGLTKCNPDGGGAGWKLEDVVNAGVGYGTGASEQLYYDISDELRH
jgi:hypothetical protein